MILALALSLVSSQVDFTPASRVREGALIRRRGREAASFAFFEAFNGAGTTTACSTTAPTGARGEALTFTRGSTGTCTKTATGGLATTGIANGDLVVLSSNVARVEYDSAGTLGLRVESSRTNIYLRSEELDNAVWTLFSTATITANATTAPDNAATADRVNVGASPTSSTMVYQAQAASAATLYTCTGYAKAVSGSGTIYMNMGNNVDFTTSFVSTACSINSTTWTRCQVQRTTTSAVTALYVGSSPSIPVALPSNFDFYFWGADCETGAYATSYIPTTSAAVTRSADSAGAFTIAALGPSASMAASVQFPSTAVGAVNIAAFGTGGAGNNFTLYRTSDTAAGYQIGITTTGPAVASMGTAVHRTALADNAGTRSAFWDLGSVAAPAASLSGTQTLVWVGAGVSGGTPSDGIVSRFCLDPSPTRCR